MRRTATILATAAYLVPVVPHVVGPPYNPHRGLDHNGRAECQTYSFDLIGFSLVVALFGTKGAKAREYWPKVVAIGLWYFIVVSFLPFGS